MAHQPPLSAETTELAIGGASLKAKLSENEEAEELQSITTTTIQEEPSIFDYRLQPLHKRTGRAFSKT
ncbi:hypothetical protein J5N97_029844 [Dioscorea zingiberensis]|uniref:Uncharacterized protein n=1 Tax=Dioscorea zingiberensis TaxID=325984 RepID=A0A9D5BWG5_9LILI|nr:hypothetical protein J5N97_029844 [Dioscorea zingiberensis]